MRRYEKGESEKERKNTVYLELVKQELRWFWHLVKRKLPKDLGEMPVVDEGRRGDRERGMGLKKNCKK